MMNLGVMTHGKIKTKIKMSKEDIKLALVQIEQDCIEREVGDGKIETYINTNKFYNRVKGLMSILNQNKDKDEH